MTAPRHLAIGLSLSVTWLQGNAWRRPGSRAEDIFAAPYFAEIARAAEAAKLDFLFRPDTLFVNPEAAATQPGFSALDPTLMMTALAMSTTRIGLVTTASTAFYPPYIVARQLQSLHRLSGGRAGWNVVTALDGHENFGLDAMPSSDARYAQAREFTDVVRALWQSYPPEALRLDHEAGIFADPDGLTPIAHEGAHFRVKGPLNVPADPAGRIPLFQAGASEAGRDFAARIADGIFAATPDRDAAAELRADLRSRAEGHGRSPGAVRVLPGLSFYLAPTRAEARDLFEDTHRGQDRARRHAMLRDNLGLDLSQEAPDRRVTPDMLPPEPAQPRSRTHAALLRRLIARETPRLDDLLDRPEVAGSAHWRVIGTPEDAAREIADWHAAGALDGVIALPGGSLASLDLFLGDVVPRLVAAGLFRADYAGQSFADHLGLERDPRAEAPRTRSA